VQDENEVGDAGAMAIGEAMKVNGSVQILWLVRFCASSFLSGLRFWVGCIVVM
jgi:hypothetical protein